MLLKRTVNCIGIVFLGVALSSCATDTYVSSMGHRLFLNRNFSEAAKAFSKEAEKPSTNQVLFLFDQGSALFAAQQYKEAISVFLKAEKLTEIKDYTSIGEEVGTLLSSDNIRGYKGEDFEKVLVNVYLAMAYAAIGNIEDAQVEARKINLLLYRMIHEGKRNYEESSFARYFSAVLWESSKDWNDAYIDYKKTYELDPHFPSIGKDLLAMSAKLHFVDDEQRWRDKFPSETKRSIAKDEGEIVFIFERGQSPMKVPRGNNESSLPRYIRRYSSESGAKVWVNGELGGETKKVLDIEDTSIRYLEDRIGRMMAAKIAGTAAKGAVAVGVGKLTKNEDLGWLSFYLMAALDRADLRSWKSLPASLDFVRIPLKAGKYELKIDVLGITGQTLRSLVYNEVAVDAGKKTFLMGR